jgi:hypothetical protein
MPVPVRLSSHPEMYVDFKTRVGAPPVVSRDPFESISASPEFPMTSDLLAAVSISTNASIYYSFKKHKILLISDPSYSSKPLPKESGGHGEKAEQAIYMNDRFPAVSSTSFIPCVAYYWNRDGIDKAA